MLQSRYRSGSFDREITFIRGVVTDGASNEDKITSWSPIPTDANVFASVLDLPGTEMPLADRITYSQRTQFIIYYRADILVTDRIYYNSKVYEILSINEVSRNKYLALTGYLLDNEVYT